MIDEFIEFARQFFRLVTLGLAIIILTLFLFGFIGAIDTITYLLDLVIPLWGKLIKSYGLLVFSILVVALFLFWYFAMGHPDLRGEE